MARGMSNQLTMDEQLIKIDSDIEAAEKQLANLKNRKEELERQIKMAHKEFVSSRGLSAKEASRL